MIQLNIKAEDRQIIAKGRYAQPHPRVMQKYDALHLKDCELSNKLICFILGVNKEIFCIFALVNLVRYFATPYGTT
jgi:hypothetical protein